MEKKPTTKPKTLKKLTPQEKLQKRTQQKYRNDVKSIFINAGFARLEVEGTEFVFKGRTGEIDKLFVYENILIVCEDTCINKPSDHLLKKKVLFDLILNNKADFVEFLRGKFPEFEKYYQNNIYQPHHFEVQVSYFSRYPIPDEHIKQCKGVAFFDYSLVRYFTSLGKIVEKSSKFELFKFFGLSLLSIGENRVHGKLTKGSKKYKGFLLPESNSNYPAGFKVLSFYVDPETLLQKSYVLRKDSWQHPDAAYQRMLEPRKIKAMRKYLSETKKVYVNNLIATLPGETKFICPSEDKQLSVDDLLDLQQVEIQLPDEFNSIGLIDGQHRVYSYHEGSDVHDSKINKLRKCQNLLVTAIMYPMHISEFERTKFEAELFLEINNEQTKARGDLKQAIELIVKPFSTTAISKAIITSMAKAGPLKGLLEESYFDEEYKIKTSSIVSYGLKPLVKFDGDDTLMKVWSHPDKTSLALENNKELLNEYVSFCAGELNKLLLAFKLNTASDKWSRLDLKKCVITPTTINGFIVCLRELIKTNKISDEESYKTKLAGIDQFDFSTYKSSHWKQLGVALFNQFFKE